MMVRRVEFNLTHIPVLPLQRPRSIVPGDFVAAYLRLVSRQDDELVPE
jgi:hypothetical protein